MLTVLLSTRNRGEILRSVLKEYCDLEIPSSGWKLVVVDNGSSDNTAEVVASFANLLPVRYLSEPQLGKNNALNAGLAFVEGDLAVFTDDDAFPRSDWLVQLRKAADAQPEYVMFGGPVVPRWSVPPPPWIQWVDTGWAFTLTDIARPEGPVLPNNIYGPNMAVRTSIFESGVRFDTSIGPRGYNYAMGSETELLLRLGKGGGKAWYTPSAVVEHFIREEQINKNWVLRRGIRYGRGYFRLYAAGDSREKKSFARIFIYLSRKMFAQAIRAMVAFVFLQEENLFRSRWYLNYFRGQLIEAWSLLRTGRDSGLQRD